MINFNKYGIKANGKTDDSMGLNKLIADTDFNIIDLQGRVLSCNSTINIARNNITLTNGILDFSKNVAANKKYNKKGLKSASFSIGINIDGDIMDEKQLTYGVTRMSNLFHDFVRVNEEDSSEFEKNDYVYLSSNKQWDSLGTEVGEILKINTVGEKPWTKYSFEELQPKLMDGIQPPPVIPDGEKEIHFYNSTNDSYEISENARIAKIKFIENITISNMCIISKSIDRTEQDNVDNTQLVTEVGIFVYYGKNVNIHNCIISNCADAGIRLVRSYQCNINNNNISHIYSNKTGYGIGISNACAKINIDSCNFQHTRHSVSIGGTGGVNRYIQVKSCHTYGDRDASIDSHSASEFIQFINNNINVEGSDDSHDGIIVQGKNAILKGNTITGRVNYGIRIQEQTKYTGVDATYQITNNNISTYGDYRFSCGIITYTDTQVNGTPINSLIISDNIIDGKFTKGVNVYKKYENIKNISIVSNIFKADITFMSINVTDCTNIIITNNNFTIAKYGCYFIDCDDGIVSNNIMKIANIIDNSDKDIGVYIRRCNNMKLLFNDIMTTKHSIYVIESNNMIISSNHLQNEAANDNKNIVIYLNNFNQKISINNNLINTISAINKYGIFVKDNNNYIDTNFNNIYNCITTVRNFSQA